MQPPLNQPTPHKSESRLSEENDSKVVVPGFNIGSEKKPDPKERKQQNSDMGSDCAYFDDKGDMDEPDTLNFKLEKNDGDNSDAEYADFQH